MRSLAGPLSERPLAHYAPLDREPGALLRSQARSLAPCPLSRYFTTYTPIRTKSHLPHPPPARACPFTPHRFRSGRARSDSSPPPAPPAGGQVNKTMQLVRSLAGTRLRYVSLRSACSPLAHYAPLDREPGALLRSQARSLAPCPLSRYFTTYTPIRTKSHLPHPPPARACPFTPHRFRSGRARSDSSPPPAPPAGGLENKQIPTKEKKYLPSSSARARGPRAPLAPRPCRSARARFAINTIMNK